MRAMHLYCGGSFMEEISVTKLAFMISSTFYWRRRSIWRKSLYFRGSVTTTTLQNVQQHLRWTGWWAVRQGKRSIFTLLTGQRIQISPRFNMEALWNTNTKNLASYPITRKERDSNSISVATKTFVSICY